MWYKVCGFVKLGEFAGCDFSVLVALHFLIRHRKLVHMEGQEKPVIVALYENMKLTMAEAERVKPGYIEMAESLL